MCFIDENAPFFIVLGYVSNTLIIELRLTIPYEFVDGLVQGVAIEANNDVIVMLRTVSMIVW